MKNESLNLSRQQEWKEQEKVHMEGERYLGREMMGLRPHITEMGKKV
jgi:hypothetical protein